MATGRGLMFGVRYPAKISETFMDGIIPQRFHKFQQLAYSVTPLQDARYDVRTESNQACGGFLWQLSKSRMGSCYVSAAEKL